MTFAARYTDQVAGMVLIDSTAPAEASPPAPASAQGDTDAVLRRLSALASTTAHVGLGRLYAQFDYGDLPARARDEVRASVSTSHTLRSVLDEYVAGSASMRAAAALRSPLVVLTAGDGHDAVWFAAQDELATLSEVVSHRTVDGAVHEGLVSDPRFAVVTGQAIVDVVTSVRSGQPEAR